MFTLDPIYLLISIPAVLLTFGAQLFVRYYYSKYSKIINYNRLNGLETVEKIAREHDINIKVNISLNDLSDNYNPINGTLTLSEKVARTPTVSSVGIAAHEMGHVLQHKNGFILIVIRNIITPIVNIGSTLGYFLFIVGLPLQLFNMVILGIILFSLSTLFTIITLPIEIDASVKALRILRSLNIVNEKEVGGVKKVLTAAALTYLAAVMQSLSSLLYYILRAFNVKKKD